MVLIVLFTSYFRS
ncbi:hypothetical protein DRB05_14210 [Pseudoalteromonas sp. A757]|nr:hypothetical protein DRB05_14210 [Pseudoalteromonas sp. A757]